MQLWLAMNERRLSAGKIHYYTLPPAREKAGEVSIVAEFGKEFGVDEVYKAECSVIGSLALAEEFKHMEVPPGSPLTLDESMMLQEEVVSPPLLLLLALLLLLLY